MVRGHAGPILGEVLFVYHTKLRYYRRFVTASGVELEKNRRRKRKVWSMKIIYVGVMVGH